MALCKIHTSCLWSVPVLLLCYSTNSIHYLINIIKIMYISCVTEDSVGKGHGKIFPVTCHEGKKE